MKKRLPIVLLLIWLCAQSNYSQGYNNQQGYIVTNANDTIYGSIKDRNDLKTEVSFRQLGQRDFLTYSPDDITCFSIENKSIYKSCNVQLDSLGSEKIFMEVLVQGYMSLYYCRDGFYLIEKGLEQYFLSKKADQIKEVEDESEKEVRTVIIEDKRYLGIIRSITNDCPGLSLKLETLTFSPSDISRIVRNYNKCKDTETAALKPEKAKSHILNLGAKFTYFVNDMENYIKSGRYYNIDFDKKQCFSGGLIIAFNLNRKISLQSEVLLTQRKSAVYSENTYAPPEVINWDMTYLEMPISFYYTFPTNKIQPHIFGGGLFGIKIKDKSEIQTIHDSFISEMDNMELGYQIGTGLSFRIFGNTKMRLEYYYEITYTNIYSWTMKYRQNSNNISASVLISI